MRNEIVAEIQDRVCALIPDVPKEQVNEDRELTDFPGFDSLAVLEILVWLETRFKVNIPDEELFIHKFNTIGAMADYVVDFTSGHLPGNRSEPGD